MRTVVWTKDRRAHVSALNRANNDFGARQSMPICEAMSSSSSLLHWLAAQHSQSRETFTSVGVQVENLRAIFAALLVDRRKGKRTKRAFATAAAVVAATTATRPATTAATTAVVRRHIGAEHRQRLRDRRRQKQRNKNHLVCVDGKTARAWSFNSNARATTNAMPCHAIDSADAWLRRARDARRERCLESEMNTL